MIVSWHILSKTELFSSKIFRDVFIYLLLQKNMLVYFSSRFTITYYDYGYVYVYVYIYYDTTWYLHIITVWKKKRFWNAATPFIFLYNFAHSFKTQTLVWRHTFSPII